MKITFDNGRGQHLAAYLELPADGEPVACALFAHCFTCTKNLRAATDIGRALARQGIGVMRFDFTGLGESEGDFADTNFSSNVDDLVAAARYLEAEYEAPAVLVGHSLGGAAVLQAAARLESVRAVATIGAPHDPAHLRHLVQDSVATIEKEGQARVLLAGRPFTIKKQFLDDLESQHVDAVLGTLQRALLVFHSPFDQTVGIENAALIFEAARHPKSFVSLDQADHLLSDRADSEYVGAVLAAWARKYIGVRQEDVKHTDVDDNVVTVKLGRSGFRTEIMANGFSLVADEPESVGGTNTGPTPYDYLVAGLGACTAMTLRMYADHKGWSLDGVTVRLTHQKVHVTDCEDCEASPAKIDRVTRELELAGALDEAQRQRLLQIANRCPVHRTLESEIDVVSTLSERF